MNNDFQTHINQITKKSKIKYLDISNRDLSGDADLSEFTALTSLNSYNNKFEDLSWLETLPNKPNLKKLNFFGNQLKEIEFANNQISDLSIANCPDVCKINCWKNKLSNLNFLSNLEPQKLSYLEISKNNFHFADLSVFSDLSNLETLRINSNPFYGSLKLIKNLKKLKKLDISDTDVDSGLEYLSDSIEKFWCSADERKDAKCKTIYNLFANERGEVETEKNNEGRTCVKNFSQKFQEYKHKGSAEMENLKRERLERNLKELKEIEKKKQQTRYLILQLQPFNPNK